MATYASSNRTELSYIKEATFGVTPGGNKKILRYTGESINHNIETGTPNEIRSDGMSPELTQRSAETAGNIDILWSYDSYDEFLEGAMRGEFTTALAVSESDISVVAATRTFSSVAGTLNTDLSEGQWIKVDGFTGGSTANNDYFQVETITDAKNIIVKDPKGVLVDAAAGDTVTFAGSMLRNGTTLSSYTIQEDLIDAATRTIFNHTGMRVGSLSLNSTVGSDLSGSFSFMGLDTTVTETPDSNKDAAETTPVMSAVSDIKDILFNGAVSTVCFNTLNIEANSSLRGQDCIGTLGHSGIAIGTFALTGTIDLYFATKAEFDRFKANTVFSISFRSEDSAGNAYIWTLPSIQYSNLTINSTGLDTDIMNSSGFTASIDTTTNCMMQIDKVPA